MSNQELYQRVLKHRKILDDLFYDKKFFAKSFDKFQHFLEINKINIPYSVVKFYYDNQSITQLFRPVREFSSSDKNFHPILSNYPFERVFMDTMYISQNNRTLAFINCMDLFTKYGYSHMFVIEKQASNVLSSQSVITLKEFINKIGDNKIESIITDMGNEYLGDFQKFCNTENIKHYYADAGNKTMTSPIERFNYTLRLSLEKYKYLFNKIDNNELETIINSYNNTHHSSIDATPNELLSGNIKRVQKINNEKLKNYNNIKPIEGYVRVLINNGIFKKLGQNWSNEIYKIEKFLPLKNRYLLSDGKTYPLEDLQLVQKEYVMKPNVFIERVRNYGRYKIPEKEEILTRSKSKSLNFV